MNHTESSVYKGDFDCKYHIVFCPKYKRKLFVGKIADRLEQIFTDVAKEFDFKILEMIITPTYCDLIISCNPSFGVMECIKKLKMTSASILKKEFPELMKRVPNIWTRQVFIRTIGTVSLNDMKEFIELQSKK